jgi:hypothetical protein
MLINLVNRAVHYYTAPLNGTRNTAFHTTQRPSKTDRYVLKIESWPYCVTLVSWIEHAAPTVS